MSNKAKFITNVGVLVLTVSLPARERELAQLANYRHQGHQVSGQARRKVGGRRQQGVATDVVVAKATGYRAPGADHNHTRPQITFYMYTEPELDHGWLESCGGFDLLRTSTASEKLAEVGLRRSLYSSPLRVNDPHEAVVFYVPGAALNSPAPAPAPAPAPQGLTSSPVSY